VERILFSVIIPVYNVKEYLRHCVMSVLKQSCESVEVILVDDGSTDGSEKICDDFRDYNKVKIIHKSNGGLSDARNVGLKFANGEYILFLDADDYWDDSNFLNKASDMIEKENPDLIVFGYKKINNVGEITKYIPKSFCGTICNLTKLGGYNICAWDKIVRKKSLSEYNIQFRKGVYSEDMEWCSKVFSVVKSCCVLSEAPYAYRQREGSITKTLSNKNIQDVRDNYERCIDIQKKMEESYQIAFNYFLAKNFSMFLISITQIDKHEQKKYYSFINKNKYILRYCSRNREKMIYICLLCFGIRFTECLIGWIYNKRRG